ncbi:CheR family methyltransferase [Sulfurimonas sp.]
MFDFFKNKEPVTENTNSVVTQDYTDVGEIANYFHNETGIIFDSQMSVLKNKVTSFCKQREIDSFSRLLNDIKHNMQLKQELIDCLTTNETFFYREFKQIEKLVELVKNSNTSVKILCAPSSTGEEPYSIAIALLEAGINASNFDILGIDINSDAISKAKIAVYGERHLRNLTPQIISKYFSLDNSKYALNQNIKSLVSFKIANIFDDSFKSIGTFDYIFSRNMLIYFDKKHKLKAKNILESMRKTDETDVFFGHADLF